MIKKKHSRKPFYQEKCQLKVQLHAHVSHLTTSGSLILFAKTFSQTRLIFFKSPAFEAEVHGHRNHLLVGTLNDSHKRYNIVQKP